MNNEQKEVIKIALEDKLRYYRQTNKKYKHNIHFKLYARRAKIIEGVLNK